MGLPKSRVNGLYYVLILLAAWGLKHHYSRAGTDALGWVLVPTAGLVEFISGIPFAYESHTGFINREYRVIIAPACAGVNFLIIAFCMTAFSGIPAFGHHRLKLLWLGSGFLSAYLLTIIANTIRILISIYSCHIDIQTGWLTAARLHRLEGILIYFFFLSLFYMIINRIIYRFRDRAVAIRPSIEQLEFGRPNWAEQTRADLIPLFWYGLITLGVPLVNGALQRHAASYVEHSVMVLATAGAVVLITVLVRIIMQQIPSRRSRK